ncbi:hypothetical protein [Streptomyces sp. NPDC057428]|uniref:hypothetical protein n=1 Tax=Streptomyces sp. NPDC057428 TaxID=3346129 RepID=UPI00367639AB
MRGGAPPAARKRGPAHRGDDLGHHRLRPAWPGHAGAAVTGCSKAQKLYAEIADDYGQAEVLDHLATARPATGDSAQGRTEWIQAAELLTVRVARGEETRAKAEAVVLPSQDG